MKLKNIETGEEFTLLCTTAKWIFLVNKKGRIIVESGELVGRKKTFENKYVLIKWV